MPNKPHRSDFPRSGSPEDQLRFFLRYAVLAPSSHNSQPWVWEIDGDEVGLRADMRRNMPALDPHGRELIMSCGGALQHLCLAIHAFGLASLVQFAPHPDQPDLLAKVRLGSPRPCSPNDELLFRFIKQRHTHRGRFESRPLSEKLLASLREEAESEGTTLHFAQSEEQQQAIIELIQRGDWVQNRDAGIRSDVADWMAPHGQRSDGIPASALGIGDLASHFAPMAQRLFNQGQLLAKKDARLAENAPVLAILSTSSDDPAAWLSAGASLSRVLLRARAEGVWASFFNQPIQVDEGFFELRHILGVRDFPQLVFRLGYANPVPSTARRSVDEVAISLASSAELNL